LAKGPCARADPRRLSAGAFLEAAFLPRTLCGIRGVCIQKILLIGWNRKVLEGIPRKIKIIVNPRAGGGRGRKLFPLLRQKLLDLRIPFHLQFSESPEHLTHLARQSLGEGYNIIAAGGGDGTAHLALQALVGEKAVLALIPLGTGNDISQNLGIDEDLEEACALLSSGKIRKIDVVQVNEGRYLAGVGGVGFDSEVNAIANRVSRYLRGRAAYILPVLLKTLTYKPKQVVLRTDQETIRGPILMAAFGNIKSYGKGMQITPLAEPDDGLVDICWVDPVKTLRLYRFFPTVFSGDHIEMPEVRYYRSKIVRLESEVSQDLYGDGEFLGKTPFTLRVVPQALRVLVP
jgi:diacylglycerol kinase (ATP)